MVEWGPTPNFGPLDMEWPYTEGVEGSGMVQTQACGAYEMKRSGMESGESEPEAKKGRREQKDYEEVPPFSLIDWLI